MPRGKRPKFPGKSKAKSNSGKKATKGAKYVPRKSVVPKRILEQAYKELNGGDLEYNACRPKNALYRIHEIARGEHIGQFDNYRKRLTYAMACFERHDWDGVLRVMRPFGSTSETKIGYHRNYGKIILMAILHMPKAKQQEIRDFLSSFLNLTKDTQIEMAIKAILDHRRLNGAIEQDDEVVEEEE
jgi:hypothetical protein